MYGKYCTEARGCVAPRELIAIYTESEILLDYMPPVSIDK